MARTTSIWSPSIVVIAEPDSGSQILTVISRPPLPSSRPSGENATARTWSACPVSVCWHSPVTTFQIRIVRSSLPVAISSPSGENARLVTSSLWAAQDRLRFAGIGVPDPSRAVLTGTRQQPPVGRIGDREHVALVSGQIERWPARIVPAGSTRAGIHADPFRRDEEYGGRATRAPVPRCWLSGFRRLRGHLPWTSIAGSFRPRA